jgi:hypothetical protein
LKPLQNERDARLWVRASARNDSSSGELPPGEFLVVVVRGVDETKAKEIVEGSAVRIFLIFKMIFLILKIFFSLILNLILEIVKGSSVRKMLLSKGPNNEAKEIYQVKGFIMVRTVL